MKFTGFESDEQIAEMAKNEINKIGDPNFEEKFERVKPALEKRGFWKEDEEQASGTGLSDNSASESENSDIENVRKELADLNLPPSLRNELEGEPVDRIKKTSEIERDMFSEEKISWRAKNRLKFFLKPMPKKEETDEKLLLKIREGAKERADKLKSFWDSIKNKEK